MTRYVVDASVAVEYILPTLLGASLADLIESSDLIAPEMLDAEVMSVLRRWVLHGRIGAPEAETALDGLFSWPINRVPHRELLRLAWSYRHNVTAYDALYVALASIRGVPLLTADGRLARAAGLNITIQNVRLS